jgi:hypothetical protein
VGFVAGCAVGVVAAVKAAQLQRVGVQPGERWPSSVNSRAAGVSAEVTAEKLRALGDLAKERVTGLVGERGMAKHDRLAGLISSSLWQAAYGPPSAANSSRRSA